ncbi:MAG: polysaccharide deacetylase family protein [Cellulosilyticaceae bacterium]
MSGFKVLLYHEIIAKEDYKEAQGSPIQVKQAYGDLLPHRFFTYLEDFESQMAYLYEVGYHTLSLEEVRAFYEEGKTLPNKSVLITFDDMFVSVYRYAYPILKRYGFHAVGFVVGEWLFDETMAYNPEVSVCMSIKELEQMRDVFEYANHTHTMHTKRFTGTGQMVTAIQEASQAEFEQDLACCERYMTYQEAFAYPFGAYTQENLTWLKKLGYRLAFIAQEGWNTIETDPLLLYRDAVLLGTRREAFITLLEGEENQ